MGGSDDVEFVVDGDGNTLPGDDVIDVGRDPSARWLTGSVIVVVLIVAVALVISRTTHRPASSGGSPNAVIGASFAPQPPTLGSPLPEAPTQAVDVAVLDDRIFALTVGRLTTLDLTSKQVVAQTSIPGLSDAGALRLVADPSGGRLWVVTLGIAPAALVEIDPRTADVVARTSWPNPITSAATLDGALYVSGARVAVWTGGAALPQPLPGLAGLTGLAGQIVADPTRDRLILLQARVPVGVYTYRPGGAAHAAGSFAVARAQLAIVNGMIWLVGYAVTGTAVFAPVDPVSLQAGTDKDVVVDLGLGAISAAVGQSVVWLRNGSTDALWCVDARTGRVLNNWNAAPGQVASVHGSAFVATGSAVLPLVLGQCPG